MLSRDKLIETLGLEKLSKEFQVEIVEAADKLIYQGIVVKAMGLLEGDDKNDFDELLCKNVEDEETVLKFLEPRIPNLNAMIEEELISFEKESADLIKSLEERKKK